METTRCENSTILSQNSVVVDLHKESGLTCNNDPDLFNIFRSGELAKLIRET